MAQSATAIRKDIQFNWVGKDKKGNKLKGRSLAASEQALRADLRRQGVVPVKISKQSSLFKGGGKVKPEDIAIFSRQLATMLTAGIPLVQSFEIIGNGHDKPAMQKLVLDVKADIEGGTSLHEALGKHPLYFDDLYVNLVEAGEQAGAGREFHAGQLDGHDVILVRSGIGKVAAATTCALLLSLLTTIQRLFAFTNAIGNSIARKRVSSVFQLSRRALLTLTTTGHPARRLFEILLQTVNTFGERIFPLGKLLACEF